MRLTTIGQTSNGTLGLIVKHEPNSPTAKVKHVFATVPFEHTVTAVLDIS